MMIIIYFIFIIILLYNYTLDSEEILLKGKFKISFILVSLKVSLLI